MWSLGRDANVRIGPLVRNLVSGVFVGASMLLLTWPGKAGFGPLLRRSLMAGRHFYEAAASCLQLKPPSCLRRRSDRLATAAKSGGGVRAISAEGPPRSTLALRDRCCEDSRHRRGSLASHKIGVCDPDDERGMSAIESTCEILSLSLSLPLSPSPSPSLSLSHVEFIEAGHQE
jgi:hypothetical protein